MKLSLKAIPKKIRSLSSIHSVIDDFGDKNYETAPMMDQDIDVVPIDEDSRIQQLLQKPKVVIMRAKNKQELKSIGRELTLGNIVVVNIKDYLEHATPAEVRQVGSTLKVIADTHDATLIACDGTKMRLMFIPLKAFDIENR